MTMGDDCSSNLCVLPATMFRLRGSLPLEVRPSVSRICVIGARCCHGGRGPRERVAEDCFLGPGDGREPQQEDRPYSQSMTPQNSGAQEEHSAWRKWLSVEQLQRIDTLTYLLGHYPKGEKASPTQHAKGAAMASQEDIVFASTKKISASPGNSFAVAKKGLRCKKQKLDHLNTTAVPVMQRRPSTESIGANTVPTSSYSSSSTSFLEAIRPLSPSAALPLVKGPSTPRVVVENLAQQWLRRDEQALQTQAKADAVADAAMQVLLDHPSSLFSDEAAVLLRFGMGGYVRAETKGFTGLFRQRWQDFHVTEVVSNPDTSTAAAGENSLRRQSESSTLAVRGATVVPRTYDYTVPPLPNRLLDLAGEEGLGGTGAERAEEADLSFFAVNMKQRLLELQAEPVRAADQAVVVEALRKEECRFPVVGDASTTAKADVDGETHEPTSVKDGGSLGMETSSSSTYATNEDAAPSTEDDEHEEAFDGHTYYLQCTLHKQHLAHGNALAAIAQTLRIHPRAISVAGIKDYIGDTVQRVRLENVSPVAALEANRRFRHKRLKMTLSDFSYEAGPLLPGDLFGNHFRVVLRDVDVPRGDLDDAISTFVRRGFPNYYGSQRFSWFAGRDDAAFALLRHNWLAFAFLFLNYTGKDRSLRELLQRPKKYPHPVQDEYRRGVVRRLRGISIEPGDLDVAPFLSRPSLNAPLMHADGRPFSDVQELICVQLREAYFDLDVQSRRMTAQRLSSYLWNQVLTLRLHHFGGAAVLDGDLVAPAAVRQLSANVDDRQDWYRTFGSRITTENRDRYSIEDVVHPGFSFDAIALPENAIGSYYEQICAKYGLDWTAQHSRSGLRDFCEPPRPIIRKPLDLSYDYNQEARVLTLKFALERGCYANVALSELMKAVRCLGSEEVTVLPLAEPLWGSLGESDPGYVTTLQDVYEGYEDGVGFMNEEHPVAMASGSEEKIWDHVGPLFLPAAEDPYRRAHRWGSQHLLRNSERRAKESADMTKMLFDAPLARQLKEGEVDTYAGHIVPLPPNASAKTVHAKVMRRKRRYAGSPRMVTRMQRSTSPSSQRQRGGKGLPSFQSLNKNSWNFTW